MHALNEQQLAALRKLSELAHAATLELDESCSTGLMSDSNALDLPDEIVLPMRQIAQEAWRGHLGRGGSLHARGQGDCRHRQFGKAGRVSYAGSHKMKSGRDACGSIG